MGAQLNRLGVAGLALLVGVAMVPEQGATETRPPYGGTVVGSLLGEPVSFDPVRARTHAEVTVVELLFDTLYKLDDRGRPRPHLATELPKASVNGMRARIPLLGQVEFHNRSRLTADDVARTLRRVMRDRRTAWLLGPIRSVTADKDSVVVELRRKTPELARLLAVPATSITPRGQAPRAGAPIGSGPFQLHRFTRKGRRLRLNAWANHFAGRAYVDQLDLRWFARGDDETRAYEAGRAHFSQRGAVAFAGHQPKYRTASVQSPATLLVYLGFGKAKPGVTQSLQFRRALSLAISRNAFKMVTTGELVKPATLPVPKRISATQALARPALARAALQRAINASAELRLLMSSRTPLEILIDASRPDDREIAEKVVAALVRLNITATITAVSALTLASRVRRGSCDLYIGQLAQVAADPGVATLAAFAAVRHPWGKRQLQRSRPSSRSARAAFERRLPLIPLFHRGVKVYHNSNLRGIRFRSTSRPPLADVFRYGRLLRSRRR